MIRVLAALAALLVTGGALAAPAQAVPRSLPTVTPTPWVSGLQSPTAIASGLGGDRFLVTEQRGTIRLVRGRTLLSRPFLNVTRSVKNSGEQGLLGVAVSPGFRRNLLVFYSYVGHDGSLNVARVKARSRTAPRARPASIRLLLRIPHGDYSNHNGGSLTFDRSGLLYIGTGDGGSGGDPMRTAQNLRSPLGKILRVDPHRQCGPRWYCVPAGNTYARSSNSVTRLVWARGLRNPWKTSMDPATGVIWIGDVGQGDYEEINNATPGAAALNFGWSCKEGLATYNADQCAGPTRAPVLTICHAGSVPGCAAPLSGDSITGGYVYRGKRTALRGTYVFGDFVEGRIFGYRDGVTEQIGSVDLLSTFGVAPDGELLAANYGSGVIYRLR